MDEKLKKVIYIVLGIFVLFFLILIMLSSCSSRITPEKLETKIVEKAKSYYNNNENELPSKNGILTLSLSDLVAKGIIKDPDKLLEKNTTCSGTLTIENNNNYYMYSPLLNCTSNDKTYNSTNLKEELLKNIVNSGNGLYSIGDSYYFKGDKVNNNIIFDGLLWKITKINNDGSIRLIEAGRRDSSIWDDRYNSTTESTTGINNYFENDINSRIKDDLDNIYNKDDILTKDAKGFIKETSLCIGKRSITDTINDGSIECSSRLDNQYIGLLQFNEYIIASLDQNCTNVESNACSNYNYLADLSQSYWTLTADKDNTYKVFKINTTSISTSANNSGLARMVINISENTNVSGNGSEENPYVVNGMSKEIRKITN